MQPSPFAPGDPNAPGALPPQKTLRDLQTDPKFLNLSDQAKALVVDRVQKTDQRFNALSQGAKDIVLTRLLGGQQKDMSKGALKPEWTDTAKDIGKSVISAGSETVAFAGKMFVGLHEAMAGHLGIQEGGDTVKAVSDYAEKMTQQAKDYAPSGLPGKVVGGVSQMATQVPAVAGMSFARSYEDLTKQGVKDEDAKKIAAGAAFINTLQVFAPIGRGAAKGAGIMGGLSAATLAAEKKFTQWALEGKYDEIAKHYEVTKDELVDAGAVGLVMGAFLGHLNSKGAAALDDSAKGSFDNLAKADPKGAEAAVEQIPNKQLKAQLQTRLREMTPSKEDVKVIFKDAKTRGKGAMAPTEGDVTAIFEKAKAEGQRPKGEIDPKLLEEGNKALEQGPAARANEKIAQQQEAQKTQQAAQERQQVQTQMDEMWKAHQESPAPTEPPSTPEQATAGVRIAAMRALAEAHAGPHTDLSTGQTHIPESPRVTAMQDAFDKALSAAKPGVELVKMAREYGVKLPREAGVKARPSNIPKGQMEQVPSARVIQETKDNIAAQIARERATEQAAQDKERVEAATKDHPRGPERRSVPRTDMGRRKGDIVGEDPIIYLNMGIPVTKSQIKQAFGLGRKLLRSTEAGREVDKQLSNTLEWSIRALNPELLGPDAKSTAALLAKGYAQRAQTNASHFYRSDTRKSFWDHRSPEEQLDFIRNFEKGKTFADDTLNSAAQGYKRWAEEIYQADAAHGIEYEARDNYLYHLWKDEDAFRVFAQNKYGPKWNNPRFIKERGWDLYDDAMKHGLEPKYTNPEDIMLARQYASTLAHMRTDIFSDLAANGLAREKQGPKDTMRANESEWRSPNGKYYFMGDQVNQVLHNAFNTKSLWEDKSPIGLGFRASMKLKNTYVPIKLSSLFHPMHIQLGIVNADGLVTATRGWAAGQVPLHKLSMEAMGSLYFKGIYDRPKGGWEMIKAWRGQLPDSKMTPALRASIDRMIEGGFIPELAPELKTAWAAKYKEAIAQHKVSSVPLFALASLEKVFQKPIFEVWIPSLKAHAYDKAALQALENDPSLHDNPLKRMEAFRQIQKSVDNRFGEMQYDTMFMHRTVRDLGVGSMLSMGWQLGFAREYGGGVGQVAKAFKGDGTLRQKIARGDLDKAMFVGFYTLQTMMIGGLMTYAFTGKSPQEWRDYVYPKTGEKNPDGTEARTSNPFYSREWGSLAIHARDEGLAAGLGEMAANKIVPTIGLMETLFSGNDYFGNEIRDPEGTIAQKTKQSLDWAFHDILPIFYTALKDKPEATTKDWALSASGFSPAPKYVYETPTEANIKRLYNKYNPHKTPYEKVEQSKDRRVLKDYFLSGNDDKFQGQLGKMQEKYNLDSKQVKSLEKNIGRDSMGYLYSKLPTNLQRSIYKKMTPAEKERYLPYMSKEIRAEFEE